jgi:hypothetical protein
MKEEGEERTRIKENVNEKKIGGEERRRISLLYSEAYCCMGCTTGLSGVNLPNFESNALPPFLGYQIKQCHVSEALLFMDISLRNQISLIFVLS